MPDDFNNGGTPALTNVGDPLYASEIPDMELLAQLSEQDVRRVDSQTLAMEFEILKTRYNELYDFLLNILCLHPSQLPINAVHRNPMDIGLRTQDISRIVLDTPEAIEKAIQNIERG